MKKFFKSFAIDLSLLLISTVFTIIGATFLAYSWGIIPGVVCLIVAFLIAFWVLGPLIFF